MSTQKLLYILFFSSSMSFAQNIKYEMFDIYFHRLPLKPLKTESNTYSVLLEDLGDQLESRHKDSLVKALIIPGYVKTKEDLGLKIELVISPLTVTNKEIKDQPIENEKDGQKTVIHQYTYKITYSFPAKIRIINNGVPIVDQDLPAFFTTNYNSQTYRTQSSLQQAYEQDRYFLAGLLTQRVNERSSYLKDWLFSTYGTGMYSESLYIGHIKDKKGLYDDINETFAVIQEAFQYANRKENYLDDVFRARINESISRLQSILNESSDDKKARIDPKVTAMLNYNLALCYYGLNEFGKAGEFVNKIGKAGIETQEVTRSLKASIEDRRKRFIANDRIAGSMISPVEESQLLSPIVKAARDYIVTRTGDTLDVRFILPSNDVMPFGDTVWLQDKIVISKNTGNQVFYPGEIHGFSLKGIYRESLTWTKDMNTNPWTFERKFCKRIIPGAIPVFKCYEVQKSFRDPSREIVSTTTRFRRPDDQLDIFGLPGFNKWLSKLVSPCHDLSEKVKNGEYEKSIENFYAIVKMYNKWATSQED